MSNNTQETIEIQISINFGEYLPEREPRKIIRELDIMRGASKIAARHIAYLADLHHLGYIEDLSEVSEAMLLLSRISLGFIEASEFLSNDLYLKLKPKREEGA